MARTRLLVLAALSVGFVVPASVGAQEPDPVSQVKVKLSGAAMLAEAQNAGIDLDHGMQRVPGGIEAEAHVTKEQELELIALGAQILQPGQEFKWSMSSAQVAAADALLRPPAPTVRVVRADFFSTKGQGFLYVEARTTKGAQTTPVVAMTLESDTGEGTAFVSPRPMVSAPDAGRS